MEDILPLSSSGRLPEPLLKPTLSSQRDDSAAAEAATAAAALAAAQLVDEVTAPYQALPVTPATLITHNYTAALPVLDVEELGKEVGVSPPPTRHRRAHPPPLPCTNYHIGLARCPHPAPDLHRSTRPASTV